MNWSCLNYLLLVNLIKLFDANAPVTCKAVRIFCIGYCVVRCILIGD